MKPGALSAKVLEYLKLKLESKDLWAKYAIKDTFSVGVSTTSRVESLHSLLKKHLNSNSRLCEVLDRFKKIVAAQIDKFQVEFERHSKDLEKSVTKCQLMQQLSIIYSPYALKKLEQIGSKAFSYHFEPVSTSVTKWYLRINLVLNFFRGVYNAFSDNAKVHQVHKKRANFFVVVKIVYSMGCLAGTS